MLALAVASLQHRFLGGGRDRCFWGEARSGVGRRDRCFLGEARSGVGGAMLGERWLRHIDNVIPNWAKIVLTDLIIWESYPE